MDSLFDVVIIGGGINGCGCAADASLRGLKVLLCEQSDIASKTSSNSTKLIHGGLRYLENGELGMVRKALIERQRLTNLAPYLITPLSFMLGHSKKMRPIWLLYAGLFLYDHLTFKNKMPKSKFISAAKNPLYFEPLKASINKGFLVSDCTVDDARLVMANAIQAERHGATILTRTKLVHAQVVNKTWELTLQGEHKVFQVKTKSVINAGGPWIENVSKILRINLKKTISKVKGSHIIVPKIYEGDQAYMLQNDDKRIIFVIPYFNHTLIGTTEILFNNYPANVQISEEEIIYLLGAVNTKFKQKIEPSDILYNYSGIRPLISNPQKKVRKLTRDYDYSFVNNPAPVINIYGGKLTTYRKLAQNVVDQLKSVFPKLSKTKTQYTFLPGSKFGNHSWEKYKEYATHKYHWIEQETLARYLSTYGTLIESFLGNCKNVNDLGIHFGDKIYQVEIDYLIQKEWAKSIDDIIWRRTKLGFIISDDTEKLLSNYLASVGGTKPATNLETELLNT